MKTNPRINMRKLFGLLLISLVAVFVTPVVGKTADDPSPPITYVVPGEFSSFEVIRFTCFHPEVIPAQYIESGGRIPGKKLKNYMARNADSRLLPDIRRL